MASSLPVLQLQYGVNVYATHVYKKYRSLPNTAYYPDPEATELKKSIASYVGVDQSMILCGSGSDELLDLYIRMHALRTKGLKVAISPPTYYQYDNYGRRVGATIVNLPHDRSKLGAQMLHEHGCDVAHTIVMLDSPANPSGDVVEREQFIDLLEAGYQVFADEAYFEFCGKTVADLVLQYPGQLIVSRSLSKVAAMAGSRVGYVIAAPPRIEEFRRQKLLFNVGSESQHRALYAIEHMPQFIEAIAAMREAKARLVKEIASHKQYQIFSSLDMYTIFKHAEIPGERLQTMLREDHGIDTYRFPNFKGHDVIRAAVLQLPVMQRFTDALRSFA